MPQEPDHGERQPPRPWYARAWRSFNTWRRERWRFRLLLLLLIFGLPVSDRLFGWPDGIQGLMRIATDAIYFSGAPKAQHYYYVYYRAQDASLLRHLLWRELDRNGDGVLDAGERQRARAAGLDVSQFTVPVTEADLDQLVAAAHALHLVPSWYTAGSARRQAFYAARAEAEEFGADWRRKVDAKFAQAAAWPDYTKWATWKRGISEFAESLLPLIYLFGVGIWLLIWFLTAFAAAAQVKSRRLVGFLIGAIGSGSLFYPGLLHVHTGNIFWWIQFVSGWAVGAGFFSVACVGGAAGLWAGRLAGGIRRPRVAAGVCAAVVGLMLVPVGLPGTRNACQSLSLITTTYASALGASGRGVAYVPLVTGALLLLASGAGSCLLHRCRRERAAAGR